MSAEILIALPPRIEPVTEIRSTLVQSSRDALRQRGYSDRYLAVLDPRFRHALLETMAPEWLPIEMAAAHYAACDALGLETSEVFSIGDEVGRRIQGTFLGTLVRTGRAAGLTPWIPLAQFPRLWARIIQGGAVGLTKVGPKDCLIEFRQLSLCRFDYFRIAYCGVVASGIALGGGRAISVRVDNAGNFANRCVLRCAWV